MTYEKRRPRGKAKLTDEQRKHLDFIVRSNSAFLEAQATARARIQQQIEAELEEHLFEREKAIYEGIELGIPKKRIYEEGLGTTSPNYVYDVEKRWNAKRQVSTVALAHKEKPRFSWGKVNINKPRLQSGIFYVLDEKSPNVEFLGSPGWYINFQKGKVTSINPNHELIHNERTNEYAEIESWVEVHYDELGEVDPTDKVEMPPEPVKISEGPDLFGEDETEELEDY